MINFAPVPCKIGCELCPAQAVGRGAWPWLHTLLPFHPASTTRGTEGNVKLLFHIRWLLLRGKARLWGSVLLRMGHSEGCFSQPNPPLCSRAWPWQRKAPAQGQTLPHPVAASAHLALEGARINAKTNPDWGHFTQTTEWKLSTLTVYFFPQNICSAAYSPQIELAIFRCYILKAYSWPFFFCLIVRCWKAPRVTLRPSALCQSATIEMEKQWWLTRCFMLENWNFVFPVLFQVWAVDFFTHSAPILPSLSCVCLELTSKEDSHWYLQADFGHLQHKEFILNATSNHLKYLCSPQTYHILWIFSHWMHYDFFSS